MSGPTTEPPKRPILIKGPHPSTLEEEDLAAQCEASFGRTGGPGGQHRNRRDTAVRLVHGPTGVEVSAAERRSQADNRRVAIRRMRLALARRVRRRIDTNRYRPSDLWASRRQGTKLSINPKHVDYPALLAEAMDVIEARAWDIAGAAGTLGVTMSQLSRLVRHDRHAFARVNQGRVARGWHRLRE